MAASSYITEELRTLVAGRAQRLCEYCLIHEADTYLGCQVDHIISLKHAGETVLANLAYACAFCNRHKGSDVGSISPSTGRFVRFFNPRADRWAAHFLLSGHEIQPTSEIGEATARILGLNSMERVLERRTLMARGRYPRPAAQELMQA